MTGLPLVGFDEGLTFKEAAHLDGFFVDYMPGRPVLRARPRRAFFSSSEGTSMVRAGLLEVDLVAVIGSGFALGIGDCDVGTESEA